MRTTYRINEKDTGKYSITLKDEAGVAIPGSALTTATLTLQVLHTAAIVNTRNAQNIKNANNVTISEAGVLDWLIQIADATILDDTKKIEIHRALFLFTWGSPTKSKAHEMDLEIENLGGTT